MPIENENPSSRADWIGECDECGNRTNSLMGDRDGDTAYCSGCKDS